MYEKFYFNSFLIVLSAFLGAFVSLIINNIWLMNQQLLIKISWVIMTFTIFLIGTMIILYLVIRSIGVIHQKSNQNP